MLTRTIRVAAKAIVTGMLGRADVRIDGDRPWDLRVHNDRFFPRALRGSLGFGESYVDGDWDAECLDALIRRLLRRDMSHPLVRLGRKLRTLRARLFNLQTRRRSRVVAEEHYDLDHRMYQLFLGPWHQYSCCFFHGTGDLAEAEVQKLEMICDKLEITSQDRVLDIGCGWGGFAKYAAQTRGCRVVGLSLSAEQVEFARRFTAGLPVEIRHLDYRDLADASLEPFDKILICGMIEHVGYKNYRTLMRAAFKALRRDGLLLLHTIGNRATTYRVEPWIEKYIFPNSMAPAMQRLAEAVVTTPARWKPGTSDSSPTGRPSAGSKVRGASMNASVACGSITCFPRRPRLKLRICTSGRLSCASTGHRGACIAGLT
ncbi:MAG: class I SAM-dependent methyltransferase [Planctomycetes bacterium]|nr:class I SAM-dependent methyltransferase [Planctomycetota bacterium]